MAYVITQNCCKDASCVPVCPVDCIRPSGSADTEMLYIDPVACIDCGACLEECPVDAIYHEDDLPENLDRFRDMNATYFERHPLEPDAPPPASRRRAVQPGKLRVAVVGSGPAACYAASELVAVEGLEIDLYERLPTPFGLIRAGVAPDHPHTKSVVRVFDRAIASPRVRWHLNVEVGRHLSHADLMAHHHAVIYAVGASASRDLGIPGEQLPGSYPAPDFVGWYNGHPDHAGQAPDLSGQRAVIIGNGNVALDIARVLLLDADELASTDIAQPALNALSDSNIREVVIIGRRGARQAAFSAGEFLALRHLRDVDVHVDADDLDVPSADDDVETVLKLDLAREYATSERIPAHKRIVFRFWASPTEIEGAEGVEGVRLLRNRPGDPATDPEFMDTALIVRSIGYHGTAIDGVPFDTASGVIPNDRGRVLDDHGGPLPGVYVTGWIKRGSKGVIGTNRACAQETTAQLLGDFDAGLLSRSVADRDAVTDLLAERGVDPINWAGWRRIDAAELARGVQASRPRVKFTDVAEMTDVAEVTAAVSGRPGEIGDRP